MPSFEQVAAAVAGIPFMSPEQGRVIHEHVTGTHARDVLEFGTAHGVGAAYLASGGAHATSVDFAGAAYDRRRRPRWLARAWRTASPSCASTAPTRGG